MKSAQKQIEGVDELQVKLFLKIHIGVVCILFLKYIYANSMSIYAACKILKMHG